jgi:hypothetical protein
MVVLPRCRIGLPPTELQRFRLLPGRSPLLGESSLFLGVLRCFSSPGSLAPAYVFSRPSSGITRRGLPHSDTRGSQLARQLPAAFRRLATSFIGSHRLGIHRAPYYLDPSLARRCVVHYPR